MKFGFNWPQWLLRSLLELVKIWEFRSKVKEWPWPLVLIKLHVVIKMTVDTNFQPKIFNSFQDILCWSILPYKSIRKQIWPYRKKGQGQHKVIIWTILVVLAYPMLHTTFQGHRPIGSGEEDFFRFLPYMGMAAMLVMWPGPFEQLFVPKVPGGSIWNLVTIGPSVSEEKSFEIVDGRTTDGRRTDGRTTDDGALPSYKLPRSRWLRWAKNGGLTSCSLRKLALQFWLVVL